MITKMLNKLYTFYIKLQKQFIISVHIVPILSKVHTVHT